LEFIRSSKVSRIKIDELKNVIASLNRARLGSLGERIFEDYTAHKLGREVRPLHREGADFVYLGKKVDVGTTTKYLKDAPRDVTIRNKDIAVVFFASGCCINIPGERRHKLSWSYIKRVYNQWLHNHRKFTAPTSPSKYTASLAALKQEITAFFGSKGYKSRIIYRSASKSFGYRESPGNLLKPRFKEDGVKVYIDFKDYKLTRENVDFIVAFPQSSESKIPVSKVVRLRVGHAKVDLEAIIAKPHKCLFTGVENLKKEFFRRYPATKRVS
jgi:hypothetical protein